MYSLPSVSEDSYYKFHLLLPLSAVRHVFTNHFINGYHHTLPLVFKLLQYWDPLPHSLLLQLSHDYQHRKSFHKIISLLESFINRLTLLSYYPSFQTLSGSRGFLPYGGVRI